jgi:membrane protease YdiL (CAAX protease family)
MLMKAFVGLVYGIIVGFVRYRTKNTYAAMLVHSVMNTFGR